MEEEDEMLVVSYQGVTPGVPVLTGDRTQFGILEHSVRPDNSKS